MPTLAQLEADYRTDYHNYLDQLDLYEGVMRKYELSRTDMASARVSYLTALARVDASGEWLLAQTLNTSGEPLAIFTTTGEPK